MLETNVCRAVPARAVPLRHLGGEAEVRDGGLEQSIESTFLGSGGRTSPRHDLPVGMADQADLRSRRLEQIHQERRDAPCTDDPGPVLHLVDGEDRIASCGKIPSSPTFPAASGLGIACWGPLTTRIHPKSDRSAGPDAAGAVGLPWATSAVDDLDRDRSRPLGRPRREGRSRPRRRDRRQNPAEFRRLFERRSTRSACSKTRLADASGSPATNLSISRRSQRRGVVVVRTCPDAIFGARSSSFTSAMLGQKIPTRSGL